MDGQSSYHNSHYGSRCFTSTVSVGIYFTKKFFLHLRLFLIIVFITSCTESNNSTKENNTERKISSSLHSVIEELQSKREKKEEVFTFLDKSTRINEKGEIQIYIQLYEIDDAKLEDLKKHVASIDIYDKKQKLVQGWALPSNIKIISGLPYVKFIDLPTYGVSN